MAAGMYLVLALVAAGVVIGVVCLGAAAARDRRDIAARRRARAAAWAREEPVSVSLVSSGRSHR